MSVRVKAESTLTDRYQTTVPDVVRKALGLTKRDRIRYTITPDGEVVLSRARDEPNEDPVLGRFLAFVEQDMERHPERLRVLDIELAERMRSLTDGVEVDLDAPLSPEDE